MYIWVRIRSGDQSGLKNGPEWWPALVDLVFVGVDVVDLGVGRERLVDQLQRVGMELVVVVEQDDELARGHRQGVVGGGDDAAVLLPLADPDPRVGAAGARRAVSPTWGSREQSSTRQSSQSPKLWRRTDFSIARSTSAGVS